MPRPDSGPLAGILAGINQFKQTRAFYSQMETSALQRERLAAGTELARLQAGGYETPAELRAGRTEEYGKRLGMQAELTETERARRREYYDLEDIPPGYIVDADGNLVPSRDYVPPGGRGAAGAGMGGLMKAEKAITLIDELARAQGIEIPGGASSVSSNALDIATQYMMAGRAGAALTVVRADAFSKMSELEWLADLPEESAPIARAKLYELAGQAQTVDNVLAAMNELRIQFERAGKIEARTNIYKAMRGKAPYLEVRPQMINIPKRGLLRL